MRSGHQILALLLVGAAGLLQPSGVEKPTLSGKAWWGWARLWRSQ